MPSFQVPISFYYTWHLTLRCNRPLKTAIYMSLCSTASRKHPLFGPWEKWPPKIHFVPPNLRTTRIFLISWSFSTFFTPLSCGLLVVLFRVFLFHSRFPKGSSRDSRNPAFRSMTRETNETRGKSPSPPILPLPFLYSEFVFHEDEREVARRKNFFTNICLLGLLSIYEIDRISRVI